MHTSIYVAIAMTLATLTSCRSMNRAIDDEGPVPELLADDDRPDPNEDVSSITEGVFDRSNEYSPAIVDSDIVAFVSDVNDQEDIYYMAFRGRNTATPSHLVSGGDNEKAPAIGSVEGKRTCVFVSDAAATIQVSSVGFPKGIGQRAVVDAPGHANWPDLSPGGSRLLYSVLNRHDEYDTWLFDYTTGQRTFITRGQRAKFNPKNEDEFVYTRQSVNGIWHVWSFNLGQEMPTQLTFGEEDEFDPCYSPDGRFIAFAANQTGSSDIYVMRVDNPMERTRVVSHGAVDREPAWTPQGDAILFSSDRNETYDIYLKPFESEPDEAGTETSDM